MILDITDIGAELRASKKPHCQLRPAWQRAAKSAEIWVLCTCLKYKWNSLKFFHSALFALSMYPVSFCSTRDIQMETSNIFYLVIYWTHTVYNNLIFLRSLLIHDSYPDVPLFHSLLRGNFPSWRLQLLQWPLSVTTRCAWPGRGESVTELMPFMNFLVHSYTCCSDRRASPYWTFIHRWISMCFTPSLLK